VTHVLGFDPDSAELAAHYDELSLWSAPFGQLLLEQVPLRRGQVTLDVGAGTGFLTVELAQRCGPDGRVIAVDPWAAGLDQLRRKAAYLRLANVRTIVGDAAATGLPPASVDVVVSNLGINNFDEPDAVLAECRRVLRPGGSVVVSSNLVGHMAELYEEFEAALADTGHPERLPALAEHVAHRATVESTTRLFERAGLRPARVTTGAFRLRYADGAALLGHFFIRLAFLPQWHDVAGPDADAVLDRLRHRLDERAAAQGVLSLTVPMACLVAVLDA
jgi:ubiquinone/menaquinone biosynthesis C-methylase UbiE